MYTNKIDWLAVNKSVIIVPTKNKANEPVAAVLEVDKMAVIGETSAKDMDKTVITRVIICIYKRS